MSNDLSKRLDELEARVRKLSRTNALGLVFQTLVAIGLITLGLCIWAFWNGVPSLRAVRSQSVEADHFVSVLPSAITEDKIDGTVGYLTSSYDNECTKLRLAKIMWIKDKTATTGQTMLELIANDSETGLVVYDSEGRVRAKLVVADDKPRLVLLDENGDPTFSAPTL